MKHFIFFVFFFFKILFVHAQTTTFQKIISGDYSTLLSIKNTQDGGYIGVGGMQNSSASPPIVKGHILKLNADGTMAWNKTIENNDGHICDVLQTKDTNFLTIGYRIIGLNDIRISIAKFDRNGQIIWIKSVDQYSQSGYRFQTDIYLAVRLRIILLMHIYLKPTLMET